MEEKKSCFCSEAEFSRKLRAYIKYCDGEPQRLPNVAGFCRFCKITREDFAQTKQVYPLCYDVALSTFIDEALNRKALNTAATMTFLLEQLSTPQESAKGQIRILCAHDPYEDGA